MLSFLLPPLLYFFICKTVTVTRTAAVRLKRGSEGKTDGLMLAQALFKKQPAEGVPSKRARATATHRLGLDIGG
jgi:hypothetical protein